MVTRDVLLRALLAIALVARVAHAGADCDPGEVAELREHLSTQSDKADTWNAAWRWIFTGSAVVTGVLGAIDPAPSLELKHGLYGSAGKAAVGALARWILPLRIHVPAQTGDACVDLAALRKEVARVAKKERSLFLLGHAGGILVNLGGAAYVYYYDGVGKALLSIAVGYPVGLLSNYTMPRGTWKLHRTRASAWAPVTATVTVLPIDHGGWQAAVVGTF